MATLPSAANSQPLPNQAEAVSVNTPEKGKVGLAWLRSKLIREPSAEEVARRAAEKVAKRAAADAASYRDHVNQMAYAIDNPAKFPSMSSPALEDFERLQDIELATQSQSVAAETRLHEQRQAAEAKLDADRLQRVQAERARLEARHKELLEAARAARKEEADHLANVPAWEVPRESGPSIVARVKTRGAEIGQELHRKGNQLATDARSQLSLSQAAGDAYHARVHANRLADEAAQEIEPLYIHPTTGAVAHRDSTSLFPSLAESAAGRKAIVRANDLVEQAHAAVDYAQGIGKQIAEERIALARQRAERAGEGLGMPVLKSTIGNLRNKASTAASHTLSRIKQEIAEAPKLRPELLARAEWEAAERRLEEARVAENRYPKMLSILPPLSEQGLTEYDRRMQEAIDADARLTTLEQAAGKAHAVRVEKPKISLKQRLNTLGEKTLKFGQNALKVPQKLSLEQRQAKYPELFASEAGQKAKAFERQAAEIRATLDRPAVYTAELTLEQYRELRHIATGQRGGIGFVNDRKIILPEITRDSSGEYPIQENVSVAGFNSIPKPMMTDETRAVVIAADDRVRIIVPATEKLFPKMVATAIHFEAQNTKRAAEAAYSKLWDEAHAEHATRNAYARDWDKAIQENEAFDRELDRRKYTDLAEREIAQSKRAATEAAFSRRVDQEAERIMLLYQKREMRKKIKAKTVQNIVADAEGAVGDAPAFVERLSAETRGVRTELGDVAARMMTTYKL